MKKFLTVLLALSVVFTYTVGTAFALPSDGTDQAGLTTAKAEAVAELDKYLDDIDQYTEVGQKLLEAEVLKVKTAVADAPDIAAVNTAMSGVGTKIEGLKRNYLKTVVADAIEKAAMQIEDYLYLFGFDRDFFDQSTEDTEEYSRSSDLSVLLDRFLKDDGNIKLDGLALSEDDAKAFIKDFVKAALKLVGSASTDEVEEFLNDTLKVIDKYMSKLSAVEVTDAEKKALVDEIIKVAKEYNVAAGKDGNYSSSIVEQYDAVVKEAVAAAKAVKTKAEYYEVINKYLGSEYAGEYNKECEVTVNAIQNEKRTTGDYFGPTDAKYGYVVANDGAVYLYEKTIGELNKLVNMTKDVEAQIKAAKKVQAALGDYNYKDIAKDEWENAEKFRLGLASFIESGDLNDLTIAGLKTAISAVNANSKASDINAAADNALAVYEAYTKLAQYKAAAIEDINAFAGYEYDWTEAKETSAFYDQDTLNQIDNLQELYSNYINAADSTDKVDSYVDAYYEKVDKYNTKKEAKIAEDYEDVAAAIDLCVENIVGNMTLNADQKALIDRVTADLKARVKSGEAFPWVWVANNSAEGKANWVGQNLKALDTNGSETKFADVIYYIANSSAQFNASELFGYRIDLDGTTGAYATYDSSKYGQEKNDLEKYKGYLAEAAGKATSWSAYLAEYDKYVALCDAVETQASKEYKEAVKAAEEAIAALGTAENTKAFEAKLAAAKKALDAVDTKFNAMLPAEQVAAAAVSNEDAYDEAVYELAYLKYLASLQETPTTLPTVKAFYEIARGITNPAVIKLYAKADQNKILEIVTGARDSIDAASTDDAKVDIAEKAIADLKAIAPAVDDTDYVAALAANKAEAVKYFNKYYNAAFTSDAVTAAALIEDIIAFNEEILPDPDAEAAAAALKAEIKGTHMKIGSSAAKGYIKISWKASNTTVALDGVEVYRSTKKTTGFKKISTFKVQTSKKYTTGLKKGTKYYYYVKGYKMVDGEKVYTHDSITVGRTFR